MRDCFRQSRLKNFLPWLDLAMLLEIMYRVIRLREGLHQSDDVKSDGVRSGVRWCVSNPIRFKWCLHLGYGELQ